MLYKAYSKGSRSLRKHHNTLMSHEYALQVVYHVFMCPKVSVENEPQKRHRRAVKSLKQHLTVSYRVCNLPHAREVLSFGDDRSHIVIQKSP